MKLLELTDFFSDIKKEYIVVDRLVRFEPYTHVFETITEEEVEEHTDPSFCERLKGVKSKRIVKKQKKYKETTREGTRIVLEKDIHTFVSETPEKVAILLAVGDFKEVKGL